MINKATKYYSYEDWLNLDTDELYELIDGHIYMMASPSIRHQVILARLFQLFGDYLRGSDTCQVLVSPVSVRLDEDDDTVLFPDLLVACDEKKRRNNSLIGPPNLVVEILSPSSVRYDRVIKYNKYQDNGVQEYWIVDPARRTVTVFTLRNGRYDGVTYGSGQAAESTGFPGLRADIDALFGGRWMEDV